MEFVIATVLILVLVGFLLWLVNTVIPMNPPWIKTVINGLVGLAIVIWLIMIISHFFFGYHLPVTHW